MTSITMMKILPLLSLVCVALLAPTLASPVQDIEKRLYAPIGTCFVNGNTYTHGQVFNIPGLSRCLKYRCDRGAWDVYEEACVYKDNCHPVGSSFEDKCNVYRCNKSFRDGFTVYELTTISTRCEDYYGRCYNPGSQFSYSIKGHLYNSCTCSVQGSGYINYNCWGK